jgi:nucleoside-diphosphate-sugar epimerase
VATSDRVLVTGGSGWFGRSALSLLWHAHGPDWVRSNVLATASSSRRIDLLDAGTVPVRFAPLDAVADFAPSLVINCAFLTRDKVALLGARTYRMRAEALTNDLLSVMGLPSVRRVITFSSGAAVPSTGFPADISANPYGVLKAREERLVREQALALRKDAVVARVWAVSGRHIQRPEAYAISDFVLQALRVGCIEVHAATPVIRAYALVDDVIALAVAEVTAGSSLFDSNGVPVEVGDLALRVARHLGATVHRPAFDPSATEDRYCPGNDSWSRVIAAHGFQPATLDEQLGEVLAALRTGI